MKANPGGLIPAAEVIGRDALIGRLWQALDQRSLLLTAERRMGKTCLVKKMVAEAPSDRLAIYRDLEAIRSPLELVDCLFRDTVHHLGRVGRTAWRVRKLMARLGGAEIARTVKLPHTLEEHWKPLLSELVRDLVEDQKRPVVLIWDEVPLMLFNIKEQRGPETAMELLDTLRATRQQIPMARMVFTGSIGMHNLIRTLREHGYANDPTNDLAEVEVPPLAEEHAMELARRLLEGEHIRSPDPTAAAEAIARAVDGVPFYIHHVIDRLARDGRPADPETVADIVEVCLRDPGDPWHLTHFRARFEHYYQPEDRRLALAILDALAAADGDLAFDALVDALQVHLPVHDLEAVRRGLGSLQLDHYIVRSREDGFRFRFPMIERWWRIQRDLA